MEKNINKTLSINKTSPKGGKNTNDEKKIIISININHVILIQRYSLKIE